MKIIGIYKITSPTNRIYIGQSVNIIKRKSDYKSLCNCNEQHKLFNSLKKYGFKKHKFEIIHTCTPQEIDELEIYYISLYDSCNKNTGLNIRGGGGNGRHSKETREKISKSNLGKKMSDESKLKMSISRKGKVPWNKGLKGSQTAWNKGKKQTPEHVENNRKSHLGKNLSEEQKIKISEALKGVPKSKEHAKKSALAQIGKIVSQETKDKQRNSRLNYIQKQKNKN